MAWKVTRTLGAGQHYIGSSMLTFDEDGVCVTEDADAVALARIFPQTFLVQDEGEETEPPPGEGGETEPPPPGEEGGEPDAPTADPALDPSAGAYTAADLEALTVTDLRDLASTAQIAGASRMTKAELVAALLAAQGE